LGNIGSYIERLDQEFMRSLQNIDAHTTDYIDRLKDETDLYTLIIRTHKYFTRINDEDSKIPIIMCRIEHLYYKTKSAINALEETVKKARPDLADLLLAEEPVESLCKELYTCSHDRTRTRTLLCHVYHIALQNDFQQAKDMILMSHIQENIHQADIETQILYNRTIVQVGICAFRCGFLKEAAYTLMEISSSGKAKELLGQGYSQRHSEKTPEQEKLEKQRQLPAHMHINLELLECVFLTCSMLLEIPNMAQNVHDVKRKVISKPFRKMVEYNDRQLFIAPPENLRDHIMSASRYMASGEWQKAVDTLLALDIWSTFANEEEIKDMLRT
jgi:translation initiation factor 3 subunit C